MLTEKNIRLDGSPYHHHLKSIYPTKSTWLYTTQWTKLIECDDTVQAVQPSSDYDFKGLLTKQRPMMTD